MNHQIVLTITEVFISLVIESTILAGLFSFISNKANEKQQKQLQDELMKIEGQNKLIHQSLGEQIKLCRDDILSQIKESVHRGD